MYLRDRITAWVIAALVLFTLGALMDIGVAATTSWGYRETKTIYTHVGLYKICNGTRIVTRRDQVELWRSDPKCFSSTKIEYDWMTWALVSQSLGLIASVALLVAEVAFLVSLRWDWIHSRSTLVALIPIAICASAFNLIGSLSVGVNLDDLRAGIRHDLGLDLVCSIFFAIGAILCTLDLQGCCMTRPPSTIGKGLTRPI